MATGEQPRFESVSPANPVSLDMQQRVMKCFPVFESEFNNLAFSANPIILVFLGISAGAWIAFWITGRTVSELSEYDRALFTTLTWSAGFITAFLIALGCLSYWRWWQTVKDIKKRPPTTP